MRWLGNKGSVSTRIGDSTIFSCIRHPIVSITHAMQERMYALCLSKKNNKKCNLIYEIPFRCIKVNINAFEGVKPLSMTMYKF